MPLTAAKPKPASAKSAGAVSKPDRKGRDKPAAEARRAPPAREAGEPERLGFFQRLKGLQVRLVRQGFNFQVVFEGEAEREAQRAKARRAAKEAFSAEAMRLSEALSKVLDRHPSARSVLVQLRVVEKGLRRRGLDVLDEVPVEVLQRALFQLDTLVLDWSSGDLAGLRAKLQATLVKRETGGGRRRAVSQALSDFSSESKLHVGEVSESVFREADQQFARQWERSFTGRERPGAAPAG